MLLRLFLVAGLALSLQAEDHWVAVKSGPFEVFTTGSERAAREKLMYLEQFRETLRVLTGKQDLRSVWPIRVVVFKNASQIPAVGAHFALGRDGRMEPVVEAGAFSRDALKALARVLLRDNSAGLPEAIEDGLGELLSTLDVNATRVTLGAPVPAAERSHSWALLQLVSTNPQYAGRSHVMISNLEQSGDFEAACRNAFEKSAAQINQEADAYLKAGTFATAPVSGRALSMTRDLKLDQLDRDDGPFVAADALLAAGSPAAESAYLALHGPRSAEGLGLLSLKAQKKNEAQRLLQSAVDGGSDSARAWLEAGRLQPDESKARAEFQKAAALNSQWGEPYFQMAELDKADPERRAADLKKAAGLDPHNIDYWEALARAETAAKNFAEAQKAWAGAERAAANDEERARIHQVRLQLDREQAEFEASERKRIAEEKEQDIERVKAQSEVAIHAAEEQARKQMNADGAAPPKDAVWMDELKGNASVDGTFVRLDCLNKQARMVIKTSDGKIVQLLIRDPNQIAVSGGGEKTMGCGTQPGSPRVHVEYEGKPDAKLRTTGDVTTIEFR
ncbi:MAG TPA: hypothetical protein VKX49_04895 [Bryobacteraceae bacterium]|nr:hypothetical protein [Bryobacteraceae bacterium]